MSSKVDHVTNVSRVGEARQDKEKINAECERIPDPLDEKLQNSDMKNENKPTRLTEAIIKKFHPVFQSFLRENPEGWTFTEDEDDYEIKTRYVVDELGNPYFDY